MSRHREEHGAGWRDGAPLVALGALLATLFWLALFDRARRVGVIAVADDTTPVASDPPRCAPGVVPLIRRVCSEIVQDRIAAVAGGITFFVLLALFPGIAAVFSLYGLVGDPAAIGHGLDDLSGFLPGGAIAVLDADIARLVAQGPRTLGLGFVIGLVIALWSASGGVSALIDGLNIANETRETRSFLGVTVLALFLAAVGVALAIGMVFLTTMLPGVIARLHPGAPLQAILNLLLLSVAYGFCVLLLALIYAFGPAARPKSRAGVVWASLIVAALWIGGTFAFSWYVQTFGSYDRTYGALGAVVGFLTWLWLSLTVLLAGAELAYEIDHRRDRITPAALSSP
jgi:membrane protein